MKLDEEMNQRALGAEHLVDQDHSGDANKTCPECGGSGKVPDPAFGEYDWDCPACHGTGKAVDSTEQPVPATDDDRVLAALEKAFSESEKLPMEKFLIIGKAIQEAKNTYISTIAKRDEAHKKQVDSLFRDIRLLEKESWERGESLSCAKEHLKNAEKRIAELEALSIVQENLPVPQLRKRITDLEAEIAIFVKAVNNCLDFIDEDDWVYWDETIALVAKYEGGA